MAKTRVTNTILRLGIVPLSAKCPILVTASTKLVSNT